MDHALGVLFVEIETIATRITQTVTEGKSHTKVADVGEAVVVEEVSWVDLEAAHLNRLIKIKLQVGTNTKEAFCLNNISHPTVQVSHRTKKFREVGFLI